MTANNTVLERCHYDTQATVRYPFSRHQGQQLLSRASPLIKRTMFNRLTCVMRRRVETRLVSREDALRERRQNTVLITTRGALIRTSHNDRNPHRRNCHSR